MTFFFISESKRCSLNFAADNSKSRIKIYSQGLPAIGLDSILERLRPNFLYGERAEKRLPGLWDTLNSRDILLPFLFCFLPTTMKRLKLALLSSIFFLRDRKSV